MRPTSVLSIALGIAILLGATYAAAAALVWDELTQVPGGCPASQAANDPTRFVVPPPNAVETGPYAMPAPEAVVFSSRDAAISISGWWIAARREAEAPAVVIVHGHRACKRDQSVLLPAGMLYRNGFSVLLIDLRDHGDSTVEDGRYAGGTEEYRDVLGAWDWLQAAKRIPPERIGLLGISLGAATVLIASGEEPRVAAVWEDSSFADIRVAIRAELARNGYPTILEWGGVALVALISGDDLASFSPLDAVRRLNGRPLFITHGTKDRRLSVEYAADLAAAVEAGGGRVDSWIVPGAGHTDAMFMHPDEYERRLVAFFGAALGHER